MIGSGLVSRSAALHRHPTQAADLALEGSSTALGSAREHGSSMARRFSAGPLMHASFGGGTSKIIVAAPLRISLQKCQTLGVPGPRSLWARIARQEGNNGTSRHSLAKRGFCPLFAFSVRMTRASQDSFLASDKGQPHPCHSRRVGVRHRCRAGVWAGGSASGQEGQARRADGQCLLDSLLSAWPRFAKL